MRAISGGPASTLLMKVFFKESMFSKYHLVKNRKASMTSSPMVQLEIAKKVKGLNKKSNWGADANYFDH